MVSGFGHFKSKGKTLENDVGEKYKKFSRCKHFFTYRSKMI
jgi:hypothetical protein